MQIYITAQTIHEVHKYGKNADWKEWGKGNIFEHQNKNTEPRMLQCNINSTKGVRNEDK